MRKQTISWRYLWIATGKMPEQPSRRYRHETATTSSEFITRAAASRHSIPLVKHRILGSHRDGRLPSRVQIVSSTKVLKNGKFKLESKLQSALLPADLRMVEIEGRPWHQTDDYSNLRIVSYMTCTVDILPLLSMPSARKGSQALRRLGLGLR